MTMFNLSMALALAGMGCFVWSVFKRVKGVDPKDTPRGNPQTPLWWLGFVLTLLALLAQRFA
jgi:hypothetical protein